MNLPPWWKEVAGALGAVGAASWGAVKGLPFLRSKMRTAAAHATVAEKQAAQASIIGDLQLATGTMEIAEKFRKLWSEAATEIGEMRTAVEEVSARLDESVRREEKCQEDLADVRGRLGRIEELHRRRRELDAEILS